MFLEIKKAVNTLKKGGIIIYPSDTMWAIGCDATNQEAINKIYKIKKRDINIPFICLVSDYQMLEKYVETDYKTFEIINSYDEPTTIIFEKTKNFKTFPNSVALRIPKDSFCQKLIKDFKKPIISSSVNISGDKFPYFYRDINKVILEKVDYKVKLKVDKKMNNPSRIIKINQDYTSIIIRS